MNTYENDLAQLVEDFINTHDLYLDEPEHLREPADFARFLRAHDFEIGGRGAVTIEELSEARQLREMLRECWAAETVMEWTERVNPLLALGRVIVQAQPVGGHIALRFEPESDASLIQRLALACARGMIGLVQAHGLDRMRSCAAEPCRDVFVDTSRNKSRRFCSDRCANRHNIAAFRGRQREL